MLYLILLSPTVQYLINNKESYSLGNLIPNSQSSVIELYSAASCIVILSDTQIYTNEYLQQWRLNYCHYDSESPLEVFDIDKSAVNT